jgi:hypothetical protein
MGGGSLGPGDVGLPVPRVWGRDLGRRPMVPALRGGVLIAASGAL